MADDPYYKKCCLCSFRCFGGVEWHHNLIYAGRQVNEKFCILPLCALHHGIADKKDIRARLNKVMVERATEEELQKYSKAIRYDEMKQ